MSGATALARARQAGVAVTLDGDSLALSATRAAPKEVLDLLRTYKTEIVELLRCQATQTAQVDTTGHDIAPLSPRARTRTLEGNPGDVVTTRVHPGGGGRLTPAGYVALGSDDPGDDGLEWRGEVEDARPARHEPDWWRPKPLPQGSLVQSLCAAGATVRTWSAGRGGMAEIEAPAGMSADLVAEVKARGWAVVPTDRSNSEALHDSWLANVPIADLEP